VVGVAQAAEHALVLHVELVHLLGVEPGEALEPRRLGQRSLVRPHQVLERRVAGLDGPVARIPLEGAMGRGLRALQQILVEVREGDVGHRQDARLVQQVHVRRVEDGVSRSRRPAAGGRTAGRGCDAPARGPT
jgi:hypothetical protein